jgi:peptidylprolyl isomerase
MKNPQLSRVGVALALAGFAAAITTQTTAQTTAPTKPGSSAPVAAATPTKKDSKVMTTASGLQMEDTKVGTGAEAKAGVTVTVHYTGWLLENGARGKKFDSSVDRGEPFKFPLGGGRVIKGWDEGVQGMKVGGKRTLTIPPELGYGARGAGAVIPPGATLVFEVELLGV